MLIDTDARQKTEMSQIKSMCLLLCIPQIRLHPQTWYNRVPQSADILGGADACCGVW